MDLKVIWISFDRTVTSSIKPTLGHKNCAKGLARKELPVEDEMELPKASAKHNTQGFSPGLIIIFELAQ